MGGQGSDGPPRFCRYRKGTEAEIDNLLEVAPQIIEPSTAYGIHF